MVVTESGMITDSRESQSENAFHPMDVTELGMVTDVREVHSENAPSPMVLTESGIVYDVRVLPAGYWINTVFYLSKSTPSLDEYAVLFPSTAMVSMEVHL